MVNPCQMGVVEKHTMEKTTELYQQHVEDVLKALHVVKDAGLTQEEARARQKKYGKNMLPRAGVAMTRLMVFLSQWKSPLIVILLIAAALTLFVGEYLDTAVILVTVGINVLIGFIQETKA